MLLRPDTGETALPSLTQIGTDIGWRVAPGRMIDRSRPRDDPNLADVYLRRGLILIHIPKNAGTSVEDVLFGYRVRHRTWQEIKATCPRAWRTLPKIAILRDPVDRFLSAFDYLKTGGRNETDRRYSARMIGTQTVGAFIDRLSSDTSFRNGSMRYFHFRPQVDYVCDGRTVMVDTLIPFPKMAEGLTKLADVDPSLLTHANKTSGPRTLKSDLTQSRVDQILHLYSADAALFAHVDEVWSATRPDNAHRATGATAR
ncbi:sulfotransferase family 2 domain-containing protein [Ruegeria sp. HKCCD8929]|uniref:sulfotransferase family 2 domain-containing protein n=1 Tax=Ruegeria sp. HKCCD8929 TaxID=2683006 RepID=UPI0014895186|nr:sulfotransferase family 2 domain-containing protein [Ruegeria sp. HKCCD8929]